MLSVLPLEWQERQLVVPLNDSATLIVTTPVNVYRRYHKLYLDYGFAPSRTFQIFIDNGGNKTNETQYATPLPGAGIGLGTGEPTDVFQFPQISDIGPSFSVNHQFLEAPEGSDLTLTVNAAASGPNPANFRFGFIDFTEDLMQALFNNPLIQFDTTNGRLSFPQGPTVAFPIVTRPQPPR